MRVAVCMLSSTLVHLTHEAPRKVIGMVVSQVFRQRVSLIVQRFPVHQNRQHARGICNRRMGCKELKQISHLFTENGLEAKRGVRGQLGFLSAGPLRDEHAEPGGSTGSLANC